MLIVIDKPTGYTSFDLVRKIKKIYRGEKVGHAGTLDPLATGIMLIAVGKDTKKLQYLVGLDKTYRATIDFSLLTDTRDTQQRNRGCSLIKQDGQWSLPKSEHAQANMRGYTHCTQKIGTQPTREQLDAACRELLGEHLQPLTPFSAKKVNGTKLYEYARKGEPLHRNIPMHVKEIKIIDYAFPHATIEFSVGSGTYIRSLAYVLGKKLGRGGALTALRRTAVGRYSF